MAWKKAVRIHILSKFKALTAGHEIQRYLASHAHPRINVGCGSNLIKDWLNVDLYPHFGATRVDGASAWPFADGTFQACLCEHMIEHVPKRIGAELVSEVFRVLRPGGVLRVVTPDLGFFARCVQQPDPQVLQLYSTAVQNLLGRDTMSVCDLVNEVFYNHGHRYIYSVDELATVLTRAGFSELRIGRGGEPFATDFKGVEGHPRLMGWEANRFEAMGIEARKP